MRRTLKGEGNLSSGGDPSIYTGEEAVKFRVRYLRMLVDRRDDRTVWGALFRHKETGDYWESTVAGSWGEQYVIRQITPVDAELKFGPLDSLLDQ